MPEYQITVRYSEPLLRAAVRTFVVRAMRRELGWKLVVAFILVSGSLGVALWQGDRSWGVGFLSALMLVIAFIPALLYRAHISNTIGRLRKMKNPEALFIFRDNEFTVKSDLASSSFHWSSIVEHWELKDCWLLFLSRAQFMTLPTTGVDKEVLAFVRSKVCRNDAIT